jgi:hypothetical protein
MPEAEYTCRGCGAHVEAGWSNPDKDYTPEPAAKEKCIFCLASEKDGLEEEVRRVSQELVRP